MLKTFMHSAEVTVFFTSVVFALLTLAASIVFFMATLIADYDYVTMMLSRTLPTPDLGENLILMNVISIGMILASLAFIALLRRINSRNHYG